MNRMGSGSDLLKNSHKAMISQFKNVRFMVLPLAMISSTLIGACSNLFTNEATESTSPSSIEQSSPTTERVVSHAMGETIVPNTPQRVVALEIFTLEGAVALDVPLVGAPQTAAQALNLQAQGQTIEDIGWPRPSIEKVVSLEPDLLLGVSHSSEEYYDQMSQVAPTVLVKAEGSSDWKEIFISVGDALGKSDAAQRVMADYEAQVEIFKERLQASQNESDNNQSDELQISVIRLFPDRIRIHHRDSFIGVILDDLGLSRPPEQRANQHSEDISLELINIADADVLFVVIGDRPGTGEARFEELQQEPLWGNLTAVQQNQVYLVRYHWTCCGPIAANRVIDDLSQYLLEE